VIAPSLIPSVNGPRVKTDRLDCKKLAEFHKSSLLTVVQEPNEEDEQVRDLVRSRNFLNRQMLSLKKHILAICRRAGVDYRMAVNKPTASHWTTIHLCWLEREINKMDKGAMKSNINLMLMTLGQMDKQLQSYDEEIEKMAQLDRFQRKVKALICYRGINTLTALTFVTEIGDVRRFSHPRQLTSYCGLDLSEYSSGGSQFRKGITKMGNKYIRTAAVEVCQSAKLHPSISIHLKRRRQDLDVKDIAIADRCMNRLFKKSRNLIEREKPHIS
jgi:transposase